jgi:hypothetical protein
MMAPERKQIKLIGWIIPGGDLSSSDKSIAW